MGGDFGKRVLFSFKGVIEKKDILKRLTNVSRTEQMFLFLKLLMRDIKNGTENMKESAEAKGWSLNTEIQSSF